MGKVAKPLTIVVFSPLDTWPEIVKLEKQGHTIIRIPKTVPPGYDVFTLTKAEQDAIVQADIILGPRCWYMTGLHRKHLTQALKQARIRRYGTIAKRGKNDEKDDISDSDTDPKSTGR